MPVFEIHYRFEEDGRVKITATDEESARVVFHEFSLRDIHAKGCIDFERLEVRAIDPVSEGVTPKGSST